MIEWAPFWGSPKLLYFSSCCCNLLSSWREERRSPWRIVFFKLYLRVQLELRSSICYTFQDERLLGFTLVTLIIIASKFIERKHWIFSFWKHEYNKTRLWKRDKKETMKVRHSSFYVHIWCHDKWKMKNETNTFLTNFKNDVHQKQKHEKAVYCFNSF